MKATITPHDHITGLGRAVVSRPTEQSLEQVTAWHMHRFWSSIARQLPRPRFGMKRRTIAHA